MIVATTQSGTERTVGTCSNSMIGSQLHHRTSSINLHQEPRLASRISMSVFLQRGTLEDLKIVVLEAAEDRHLSLAEVGVGSGWPEETEEASGRGEDSRLHQDSLELRVNQGSPVLTGGAFTWTDSVRALREAKEDSEVGGDSEDITITITKTLITTEEHLIEAGEGVEAGTTTGDLGETLGVEAGLTGNCEE